MIGQFKDLEVPLPDKKIGDNSLIFEISWVSYESLQKNKVLFVQLVSENEQKILIDAFRDIGTCMKAIKIKSIVIEVGLVFNDLLLFFVNLLRVL